MPHIERMIAAESNTSSSKDELEMLVCADSMRELAKLIIDRLYALHLLTQQNVLPTLRRPGIYNFGLVKRMFAVYAIASIPRTNNNNDLRYFAKPNDTVFNSIIPGVDLYLSGEWHAVHHNNTTNRSCWPCFNDLIRTLNGIFDAQFVYVVVEHNRHQLWGPAGTL